MLEYCQCEEVDKKAVYDVNQNIDKMIAENIKFSKPIVECKGKIYNCSGFKELFKGKIITQVSNLCTFCNT